MNEMMTTILKLNKEIDSFIANQREVIRSYQRDKSDEYAINKKVFETLRINLTYLEEKKDILLGFKC